MYLQTAERAIYAAPTSQHCFALINYKIPLYAICMWSHGEMVYVLVARISILLLLYYVCGVCVCVLEQQTHTHHSTTHPNPRVNSLHTVFRSLRFFVLHWLVQFIHHTVTTCPRSFRTMYANLPRDIVCTNQRCIFFFIFRSLSPFPSFGCRDICNNWFIYTEHS